jgi:transposase-like protein
MFVIRKAFKRLHNPVDVITQSVRWYLADTLSLRKPGAVNKITSLSWLDSVTRPKS